MAETAEALRSSHDTTPTTQEIEKAWTLQDARDAFITLARNKELREEATHRELSVQERSEARALASRGLPKLKEGLNAWLRVRSAPNADQELRKELKLFQNEFLPSAKIKPRDEASSSIAPQSTMREKGNAPQDIKDNNEQGQQPLSLIETWDKEKERREIDVPPEGIMGWRGAGPYLKRLEGFIFTKIESIQLRGVDEKTKRAYQLFLERDLYEYIRLYTEVKGDDVVARARREHLVFSLQKSYETFEAFHEPGKGIPPAAREDILTFVRAIIREATQRNLDAPIEYHDALVVRLENTKFFCDGMDEIRNTLEKATGKGGVLENRSRLADTAYDLKTNLIDAIEQWLEREIPYVKGGSIAEQRSIDEQRRRVALVVADTITIPFRYVPTAKRHANEMVG